MEHRALLHLLAWRSSMVNELEFSFISDRPSREPPLVMDTLAIASPIELFLTPDSLHLLCQVVRFPRAFFFDRPLLIIRRERKERQIFFFIVFVVSTKDPEMKNLCLRCMLLRVIFEKSRKVKIKEYKDYKIYYSLKSGFKT